jgi:hypothetical protein
LFSLAFVFISDFSFSALQLSAFSFAFPVSFPNTRLSIFESHPNLRQTSFLDSNLAQRMPLGKNRLVQPGEQQTEVKHLREARARANHVSLEPLRADALAALDTRGIPGLLSVALDDLQVQYPEIPTRTRTLALPDLYPQPPGCQNTQPVIPQTGKLIRAIFTAQLANSPIPCRVELAVPNSVLVSCPSATRTIWDWVARCGFLSS